MTEWLSVPGADPVAVLVRLVAALIMGSAVAWIHARTSPDGEMGASFPATLVLLAVLIAMVTQVIGDNVARAFSLVGALSIVRFRTVVRDTRDTAFVIFAVVVGMAAGAQNVWVGLLGLVVGGSAAFALSSLASRGGADVTQVWVPQQMLKVRAAMGVQLEACLGHVLAARLVRFRLVSIGTIKMGLALEAEYEMTLAAGLTAEELMREIGRIDGVQDVRIERRGAEEK
jgi:Domain of unknown function (DUF4956)